MAVKETPGIPVHLLRAKIDEQPTKAGEVGHGYSQQIIHVGGVGAAGLDNGNRVRIRSDIVYAYIEPHDEAQVRHGHTSWEWKEPLGAVHADVVFSEKHIDDLVVSFLCWYCVFTGEERGPGSSP